MRETWGYSARGATGGAEGTAGVRGAGTCDARSTGCAGPAGSARTGLRVDSSCAYSTPEATSLIALRRCAEAARSAAAETADKCEFRTLRARNLRLSAVWGFPRRRPPAKPQLRTAPLFVDPAGPGRNGGQAQIPCSRCSKFTLVRRSTGYERAAGGQRAHGKQGAPCSKANCGEVRICAGGGRQTAEKSGFAPGRGANPDFSAVSPSTRPLDENWRAPDLRLRKRASEAPPENCGEVRICATAWRRSRLLRSFRKDPGSRAQPRWQCGAASPAGRGAIGAIDAIDATGAFGVPGMAGGGRGVASLAHGRRASPHFGEGTLSSFAYGRRGLPQPEEELDATLVESGNSYLPSSRARASAMLMQGMGECACSCLSDETMWVARQRNAAAMTRLSS